MNTSEDNYEIAVYNRAQVNAIRSFRRKIERVEKCHMSNDRAAMYWVEAKLANYFNDHYRQATHG